MKEILVRDLYVQDSSFLQQGLNEILEALYESYMVVDLVSVMPGFSDKTSVKGKHYISVWKVRPCTKNKEVSNMAACPGCGGYVAYRFSNIERRDMAYCPLCGWDEEDGGNGEYGEDHERDNLS